MVTGNSRHRSNHGTERRAEAVQFWFVCRGLPGRGIVHSWGDGLAGGGILLGRRRHDEPLLRVLWLLNSRHHPE